MPKANFTHSFVKKAACPNGMKRIVYSDIQTKGLVMEARSSGGRTYYVRYHNAYGIQRNLKIGDVSSVTLEAARLRTTQAMSELALGGDPLEEKRIKKAIPNLADFVRDQYLPHVSAKRSLRCDQTLLRRHVLPALGNRRLDAITTTDIDRLHRSIQARGYAPATCNRILVLVRYIFNVAMRLGVPGITKNPSAGIRLCEVNNERQRFLTQEEVERLLNCIGKNGNGVLRHIVTFLLLTGARRAEALNAEWKEFDYHHNVWIIPRSKSGKARKVQLSDVAIELLNSLPSRDRSQYVFPNPDTNKPYVSVYHAWDKARKEAGLADVRMHDLRHSFASFLVNSGRSLYEVQRLLGHSNFKMTQRYAHLSDETLSSAVNVAASFVTLEGSNADRSSTPPSSLLAAPRARFRPRPTSPLERSSQP